MRQIVKILHLFWFCLTVKSSHYNLLNSVNTCMYVKKKKKILCSWSQVYWSKEEKTLPLTIRRSRAKLMSSIYHVSAKSLIWCHAILLSLLKLFVQHVLHTLICNCVSMSYTFIAITVSTNKIEPCHLLQNQVWFKELKYQTGTVSVACGLLL